MRSVPADVYGIGAGTGGDAAMKTIHRLKSWPDYFRAVVRGIKPFELRRDDRNFKVGDILIQQEWDPRTETYTGSEVEQSVTYILRPGPDEAIIGLSPGFVIMATEMIEVREARPNG
jgi:hypothetical protein